MNPLCANLRGTVAGVAIALVSFSAASPSADLAAASRSLPGATRPAKLDLPDEYRILLTHSIFCRLRDPREAAAAASAAAWQASQNLVLRGVVRQEEGFVAIFEDPATNQVQRIRAGDILGGATVSRITLRGVELSSPAKSQAIAVGENIAGETVIAPPVVEAQAAAPGQAPADTNSAEPQVPAAVQANAVIRKPAKGGWKVN